MLKFSEDEEEDFSKGAEDFVKAARQRRTERHDKGEMQCNNFACYTFHCIAVMHFTVMLCIYCNADCLLVNSAEPITVSASFDFPLFLRIEQTVTAATYKDMGTKCWKYR